MASLKQLLKDKLTKKELSLLSASYDLIGSKGNLIAIVGIPDDLKNKQKIIAETIAKQNKSITSILKKASERKGRYRLRKLTLIYGKKDTEVLYKEYGCMFKLDPRKVYFSPRELTERQRIANLVKANEKILVMFSGIAPFPIVIAKKHPKVEIYAIELNPIANKYAKENIKLNKITNVVLLQGDVKKIFFKIKFDRIIMPLPKDAYEYLEIALNRIKNKGVIHLYYWANEAEFEKAKKFVKEEAKKFNKKIKIIKIKKVLPYSPGIWKICLDITVY